MIQFFYVSVCTLFEQMYVDATASDIVYLSHWSYEDSWRHI